MGNCGCWPNKPDFAARLRNPAHRDIGNLRYEPGVGTIEKCNRVISRMQQGDPKQGPLDHLKEGLKEIGWAKAPPKATSNGNGSTRLVVFTDLEPDDTMAIAQLWQRKLEEKKLNGEPLIIFSVDFEKKDIGQIFEKKLLVAALMLGKFTYYILPNVTVKDPSSLPAAKKEILASRDSAVKGICANLVSFSGDSIDLYVLAPGFGNIGSIFSQLKATNAWPTKAKFRVSMYSGAYNMKAMTDSDIAALEAFVGQGKAPLTDVGKFPFFGGKDYHKWADSLTTFALPPFAKDISQKAPLLAAALKLFNDEMNEELVSPHKDSLFRGSELDDQDKAVLAQLKETFKQKGVNAYAKELVASPLFAKVAGFKKSTLKAFAVEGCDSPLCDQLVFLAEWLNVEQPSWLHTTKGGWVFDKEKGFTEVKEDNTSGMRGVRHVLARPTDEPTLLQMRAALEHYVRMHVDSLR